jgi:hypothetical protein
MLERNAPHIKAATAVGGREGGGDQQQQTAFSRSGQQVTQPGASAFSSSSSGTKRGSDSSSSSSSSGTASASTDVRNPPRPFISVQQYITQPLLINDHKFGLRVWVLVIGPKPYRAFVYQQGLVLFSSQQYNPDLSAVQAVGAASQVGDLASSAAIYQDQLLLLLLLHWLPGLNMEASSSVVVLALC